MSAPRPRNATGARSEQEEVDADEMFAHNRDTQSRAPKAAASPAGVK